LLTLHYISFPFHVLFAVLYIVLMFSLTDDDEDGFSLFSCMKSDGTSDLQRALRVLDDVEDECHVDECSLFSCFNAEGGLDVAEHATLLEMSILKEAGLLDDSNKPTGAAIETPLRPYKPHHAHSNLY
jgi:hypothetical protein